MISDNQKVQKPELLVPAGNFEKLKTAIHFGADAIYLGGKEFSLRARAGNFSPDEMEKAVKFAHGENVKVYVTINAFARNEDIAKLPAYLDELNAFGPDAVIASDPGVVRMIRRRLPHMPIHLSTQSNTTNWGTCEFWKGQGVKRLGLARELSLREIQEIRKNSSAELEVFIHGAMCISYSGRCWMSKLMTDRDANQGDCAQSCRWEYSLMESKREGEYFPLEGDDKGTYLFNSKDLCLIDHLPGLIEAGVNTLKIEGRMKSSYYVGVVTNVYRAAIDHYMKSPETYSVCPEWYSELASVSHRDYTAAFINGQPEDDRLLHTFSPFRAFDFIGVVRGLSPSGVPQVEVKNKFEPGDLVEVVDKGPVIQQVVIKAIRDRDGNLLSSSKPNTHVFIDVNGAKLEKHSLVRRKIIGSIS